MLVVVFSVYPLGVISDDSYNEGYDDGYGDNVNQERLQSDYDYEDGVMDGEDEADREHVEWGGTLGEPHPDADTRNYPRY